MQNAPFSACVRHFFEYSRAKNLHATEKICIYQLTVAIIFNVRRHLRKFRFLLPCCIKRNSLSIDRTTCRTFDAVLWHSIDMLKSQLYSIYLKYQCIAISIFCPDFKTIALDEQINLITAWQQFLGYRAAPFEVRRTAIEWKEILQ